MEEYEMLWTSSRLENLYKSVLERVINENPELLVSDIRMWSLPVTKYSVKYKYVTSRKMNIVEEYILKAALLEIDVEIDISFIVETLGLNIVFIESCINNLAEYEMIYSNFLPVIKLTPKGMQCFQRNLIADNEQLGLIEFYYDCIFNTIYADIKYEDAVENFRKYDILDKNLNTKKNPMIKQSLSEFINGAEHNQNSKVNRKIITSLFEYENIGCYETLFCEVSGYDINKKETFYKLWDFAKNCYRYDISKYFEASILKNEINNYTKSMEVGIHKYVNSYLSEQQKNVNLVTGGNQSLFVKLYNNNDVGAIIDRYLEEAKKRIIIYKSMLDIHDNNFLKVVRRCLDNNIQMDIFIKVNSIDTKKQREEKKINEILNLNKSKEEDTLIHYSYTTANMREQVIIDNLALFIEVAKVFPSDTKNDVNYSTIYLITSESIVKKQIDAFYGT